MIVRSFLKCRCTQQSGNIRTCSEWPVSFAMPYRDESKKDSGNGWTIPSGVDLKNHLEWLWVCAQKSLGVKTQQVLNEAAAGWESVLFVLRLGLTSSHLWREPAFSSFLFVLLPSGKVKSWGCSEGLRGQVSAFYFQRYWAGPEMRDSRGITLRALDWTPENKSRVCRAEPM